jgi:hypothetical protein
MDAPSTRRYDEAKMGWISRRFASPAAVVAILWSSGCSDSAGPGTEPTLESGLADHASGDAPATGPDAPAQDGSVDNSPGALDGGAEGAPPDDAADGTLATDGAPVTDGTLMDSGADSAPDAGTVNDGATRGDAAAMCSAACVHGTCLISGGCTCDTGWAGPLCDMSSAVLVPGTPAAGSVMLGQWVYFTYQGLASGLSATLTEDTTTGLVWAYLGAGQTPTQSSNLAADENTQSASHSVTHTFASPGTQTWYVGAYGQPAIASATQAVAFQVTITVIP